MFSWLAIAVFAWLIRYARLIVNCCSHWSFRPVPIPEDPSYTSKDVTIIIPTIIDGNDEEVRETIKTCLKAEPKELILATVDACLEKACKMAVSINGEKIRVLSIREANKRRQMCRAIPEVSTKLIVFADDDVVWPRKVLPWMLAPFEDPKVGGVGTSQRLKRSDESNMCSWDRIWSFLGATYLERRNFDCSACLHIDGGLPCLSGRTVAYRTSILQDDAFLFGFTHEEWRSYQLNADDDNFITRWMYSHDWRIRMQYHKEAEVQTTLENGPKYLKQCLRWVRSNWRSNLTSMFVERHYWWTQPWSTYAVLQTTLTAWALPMDMFMFVAWHRATESWPSDERTTLLVCLALWVFLFSKTVKLWGHFIRYPVDLIFMPVYVFFGYFHGFIKLYGLFTLHETAWGSREGADADNNYRMIRRPSYGSLESPKTSNRIFDESYVDGRGQLPAYRLHDHDERASAYYD